MKQNIFLPERLFNSIKSTMMQTHLAFRSILLESEKVLSGNSSCLRCCYFPSEDLASKVAWRLAREPKLIENRQQARKLELEVCIKFLKLLDEAHLDNCIFRPCCCVLFPTIRSLFILIIFAGQENYGSGKFSSHDAKLGFLLTFCSQRKKIHFQGKPKNRAISPGGWLCTNNIHNIPPTIALTLQNHPKLFISFE